MQSSRKFVGITAAVGAAALLGSGLAGAKPITWVDCEELLGLFYSGQMENVPMECGTLEVPVDYDDPEAGTTEIALSRIKATSGNSRSTIVGNPGGPGNSALEFWHTPDGIEAPEGLYENHDLVAVQPRGLVGSRPMDCDPEFIGPLTEHALHDACYGTDPAYLRSMTTENAARDINSVREALGEATIDYVGASYGTRIGADYATLFPEHTGRMVLDSNVAPSWAWSEQSRQTTLAQERRINDVFQWIADRDDYYGLGDTPLKVYGNWKWIVDQEIGGAPNLVPPRAQAGDIPRELRGTPLQQPAIDAIDAVNPGLSRAEGLGRAVTGADERNNASTGLFDATVGATYSEQAWPMLAHLLTYYNSGGTIARVDPETARVMRENRQQRDQMLATDVGMFTIVTCNEDATGGNRPAADLANLDRSLGGNALATRAAAEGAGAPCFGWEPVARPVTVDGVNLAEKPLVINSEKDPITPIAGAEEMARLMGAHFVTVGGGDHGNFRVGNLDVDDVVMTYLESGVVEVTNLPGKPTPEPLPKWGPEERAADAIQHGAPQLGTRQTLGTATAQAEPVTQAEPAAPAMAPSGGQEIAGAGDWYGVDAPTGLTEFSEQVTKKVGQQVEQLQGQVQSAVDEAVSGALGTPAGAAG